MKYKGIELVPNSEAELLVNVDISNSEFEDIDEAIDAISDVLSDYEFTSVTDADIYMEEISDTKLQVRCDGICFDIDGINLLKEIYELMCANDTLKVYIGIHVDLEEWFKDENGHEYNEDVAETWEEFMKNLKV